MLGIDRNDTFEERERLRVGLLPEIDKAEVQEDSLIIRAHLERAAVGGDRTIGAVGAGVDHAEIAERGNVAWLLAKNRLEPSLRGLVVSGPEGPDGLVEDFLRRLGATQNKGAETQAHNRPHAELILAESGPISQCFERMGGAPGVTMGPKCRLCRCQCGDAPGHEIPISIRTPDGRRHEASALDHRGSASVFLGPYIRPEYSGADSLHLQTDRVQAGEFGDGPAPCARDHGRRSSAVRLQQRRLSRYLFHEWSRHPTLEKSAPKYSNRLFENDGRGHFKDVTEKAGLAGAGFDNGVAIGDYDNDGYKDIFVGGVHQNRLYHNNGNGTFTDVTAKAGTQSAGPAVRTAMVGRRGVAGRE